MIDKGDLNRKDFSVCLPEIIARLSFISGVMRDFEPNGATPWAFSIRDDYEGAGSIIGETVEDLKKINDALYGEPASPTR